MTNLPNDDDDVNEREMDAIREVCITQTNINKIVSVFAAEKPDLNEGDIYRFFLQESVFLVRMPFRELVDKFNVFINELMDSTLLDMTKRGLLEMGYDEKSGKPVYWLKEENVAPKKTRCNKKNKGE